MSDAINEDVAFKKKLYRKKLFFIGKKCYTIHSKKIVSVESGNMPSAYIHRKIMSMTKSQS